MTEQEHHYLESGWCSCGHHRDDGQKVGKPTTIPDRDVIRAILGPTYQPKDNA